MTGVLGGLRFGTHDSDGGLRPDWIYKTAAANIDAAAPAGLHRVAVKDL